MCFITSINDKFCLITFPSIMSQFRINTDALTDLRWQRSLWSHLVYVEKNNSDYVKLWNNPPMETLIIIKKNIFWCWGRYFYISSRADNCNSVSIWLTLKQDVTRSSNCWWNREQVLMHFCGLKVLGREEKKSKWPQFILVSCRQLKRLR